ncbi:MAG: hypothetical protein IPF98_10890 [Gemmatimonadetes bacterium]|nr:hypothetical protein [Gemmatimonadota bacterium]
MMRALASLALSLTLALLTASTAVDAQGRTRNVVLIVTDGLRWQEVFTGAERALISSKPGGVRDTASLRRDFWRDTPEARREALLPFLWGTVARQGQLIGNRERGSDAHVTNTMRFSYPGYNELFTGAFDPRIDSNGYPANPNETVFEWIATRPGFEGKVGALATWDVFRNILNRDRAGIPVLDGWDPPFAAVRAPTPRMQFVDELYRTSVQLWNGNAFDAPMHLAAKEFVRANSPACCSSATARPTSGRTPGCTTWCCALPTRWMPSSPTCGPRCRPCPSIATARRSSSRRIMGVGAVPRAGAIMGRTCPVPSISGWR